MRYEIWKEDARMSRRLPSMGAQSEQEALGFVGFLYGPGLYRVRIEGERSEPTQYQVTGAQVLPTAA